MSAGRFGEGFCFDLIPVFMGISLVGCEANGSISGATQSCTTSDGLLDDTTITCTGEIETLGGNIEPGFGSSEDFEENTSDTQRLVATFTARSGTASLTAPEPDGGRGRSLRRLRQLHQLRRRRVEGRRVRRNGFSGSGARTATTS